MYFKNGKLKQLDVYEEKEQFQISNESRNADLDGLENYEENSRSFQIDPIQIG